MSVPIPRQYITTSAELQSLLDTHGGKPVLSTAKVIGLHFQFRNPRDDQLSTSDHVVAFVAGSNSPDGMAVVLQVESLKTQLVVAGLKSLLEDEKTIKVLVDVGRVARWLYRYGLSQVTPVKCVDLQLLYQNKVDPTIHRASLTQISSHYGSSAKKLGLQVDAFVANLKPKVWMRSPLGAPLLRNLVDVVKTLVRCYHGEFGTNVKTCETEILPIASMTTKFWCEAVNTETRSADTTSGDGLMQYESNGCVSSAMNLSELPIELIGTERELVITFQSPIVGVHFQFATSNWSNVNLNSDKVEVDELAAIAITSSVTNDPTIVLQMSSLDKKRVVDRIKILLSTTRIIKVMHDIHRVASWLHCNGLHDIKLVNCVDLQLLYETAMDTTVLSADILQIATHCLPKSSENLARSMHSFKTKLKPVDAAEWMHVPLSGKLLQTLAQTTKLYAQCYAEVAPETSLKESITAMTASRCQYAVENRGCKAIWFDPAADNQARSLECLVFKGCGGSGNIVVPQVEILPLELQCELDPLLDLLPLGYQNAILAIEDYHIKLVDVCLDVGRIPYVYTGKKQRVILSKDGAVVTKDTIDEILRNLGGEMRIGDDNRAGIDRQLHRISVMRSKTDEVYGLTMRVGRALRNAACILTDLLLSERHAEKSVLVLGHPGSGKTTLIRDVARCVSETMENVCIIDTSNEIGGDGLVPHECVGWARRMMVRSLEAQASVMVECVQNHTVETLIVDEIGRKAEVLAASTVRQQVLG